MIVIINEASTIINPPLYGEYLVEVLNVKYKTKAEYTRSDQTIHICIDALDRITRCAGINQPAIYSIIKGHTVWESIHTMKNHIRIKQPISIYFTNSNGELITHNTPIITFSFTLIEKEHDHKITL